MSFITDLINKITNFRVKVGDKLNTLKNQIGQLNSLTTNDKTSLVGAVNEVNRKAVVHDGTLTLGTGNGLSGSGSFTANQQGNSSVEFKINDETISKINNGQTAFDSLGRYTLRTNLNNRLGLLSSVTGGSDFYYSPGTDPDKPVGVTDGAFMSMSFDSDNWYTQLYADWRNNEWYVRTKNSGTWNSFQKLIHTGNISSELSGYVPTARTITINGVTQNLSANRTWTVPDTITRLRGTESGTYTSGDITLLAGANIAITQSGANITIASTNIITATAFYESSLKKFKTNIKPFNKSGIELINSLDIVTFDRIDDKTKNKIGIIADDTSEEFLSEDKDAVDLYKTSFIQAKAIQELNRENKELVSKNNELEKRLERLERMLENLLEK